MSTEETPEQVQAQSATQADAPAQTQDQVTAAAAAAAAKAAQHTAQTQAPGSGPAPGSAPTKLSPRSGPIVAGTLVLVLCAYVVVQTMGGRVDATTWIITTILGLGALLLLVGIAVLVRGPRNRR